MRENGNSNSTISFWKGVGIKLVNKIWAHSTLLDLTPVAPTLAPEHVSFFAIGGTEGGPYSRSFSPQTVATQKHVGEALQATETPQSDG